MTYKLTATITHKSFDEPVIKTLFFRGETKEDIMDQIKTLPEHLHNLRHYGKAAFKDERGVKHKWKLEHLVDLN